MRAAYSVIRESITDSDGNTVECYVIAVSERAGTSVLHSICRDFDKISRFVDDINRLDLSPIHLIDVIEDRFY